MKAKLLIKQFLVCLKIKTLKFLINIRVLPSSLDFTLDFMKMSTPTSCSFWLEYKLAYVAVPTVLSQTFEKMVKDL